MDLVKVVATEVHQLDGQPWRETTHQQNQRPDDGLGDRLRGRGAILTGRLTEPVGEHAQADDEDDDQDELGDD
jgi:hypothetical protein